MLGNLAAAFGKITYNTFIHNTTPHTTHHTLHPLTQRISTTMAYDPYSAGQADYYQQDPYQDGGYGYDGYDGYGYGGYEEPYTPTSPPDPDKNWIDPVKANREYLKKIQKSCIHKGFEGLKEDGLFLFEVLARSVSLKKDVFKSPASIDNGARPFMVFFKFLDTPFVEVNDTDKAASNRSSSVSRRSSVFSNKNSFTNLFQSIYSSPGDHDSMILDVEGETEGGGDEERNKNQSKDIPSDSLKKEKPVEKDSIQIEEMETIKIMKGTCSPIFSKDEYVFSYYNTIKQMVCLVLSYLYRVSSL